MQICVGIVLAVLGVLAFLRTQKLVEFVAGLEDPPLTRAHRDRITSIAFVYHLIAGLTSLSGLGVILLALTD